MGEQEGEKKAEQRLSRILIKRSTRGKKKEGKKKYKKEKERGKDDALCNKMTV